MHKKGYYPGLILVALLAIFIVQNIASVEVNILFWSVNAPRSLILIIVFLLGAISGFFFQSHRSRKADPGDQMDDEG